MPAPVQTWATNTFPTAKSLNLALYTCDGTNDNPNGIFFHTYRPLLFDNYTLAATIPSATGGSQTLLSATGTAATTNCVIIYDTAGYFGQATDKPNTGFYQFTSVINGSSGDGVTPGGWTLLSHFPRIGNTATQTSVSADMVSISSNFIGTRQAASTSFANTPFFLDLVNVGSSTWQPAVTIRDSASASAVLQVTTDSSGQASRFYSIWAGVSSGSAATATFAVNGTYNWIAPPGVSTVGISAYGAGGGGAAGQNSSTGVEFGGGGGGGGEWAGGTVSVTPSNSYTVNVGLGGAAGTIAGQAGSTGGVSTMSGDTASITAHGGHGGGAATTSGNGSGGTGGSGSTAPTHNNGGNGNSGTTGGLTATSSGGGGGSSGSDISAGSNATDGMGAPAPKDGGAGGNGGIPNIFVVQSHHGGVSKTNTLVLQLNPLQQGSTVVLCVCYQGTGTGNNQAPDPSAVLSDGTKMTRQLTADQHLNTDCLVSLHDVYNVSGGQTSIVVTGFGNNNVVILGQCWEFGGLGPQPSFDVNATKTRGGSQTASSYNLQKGTNQGPDLWIGTVGAQQTSAFTIYPPFTEHGAGGEWNTFDQSANSANGFFSRLLSGYKIVDTNGTMEYDGNFSQAVSYGEIIAAYITSAVLAGSSPITGPGGGGGAGLGANAAGGTGNDGEVILTWTAPASSNYGTPLAPAPYALWADTTTLGTTNNVNVNINGNGGVRDVVNYLSNSPIFRIASSSSNPQTIPSSTVISTGITFNGAVPSVDSYSGAGPANSGTYTIERDGIYLFHGIVSFSQNSTGSRFAGLSVTVPVGEVGVQTVYWGPPAVPATSGETNVSKTQILALQQNDLVQLVCQQDSGGNLATSSTSETRFLLVWLCNILETSVEDNLWEPPDTSFRWQSGTPGSQLPALFQQHLGNDLGFLANRPYLAVWQSVQQTGLTLSGWTTVTMDQTVDIVHGFVADNYAGWNPVSNLYLAQVPGWYLICAEYLVTGATAAGSNCAGGILPTTSGNQAPLNPVDFYQTLTVPSPAGGATVFGLQYMLPGESITPQVRVNGFGGTSPSTQVGTSRGGLYASHFEAVWISS